MSDGELGTITISVEGHRTEPGDWDTVRALPKSELPALTDGQKEAAASLHIPEEDYARSVEAGRRTSDRLLKKTERFARLLQKKFAARNQDVQLERVALSTFDDRFEILVRVGGGRETLRVAEAVVNSLFEEGSRQAEESLSRILDYALLAAARE